MASLTFSDYAKESVAKLPRDKGLLTAVWRHLEHAANDPDAHTEFPAPPPHRPDRRLCHFECADTSGATWAFSVLMADVPGGLLVTVLTFNRSADYPPTE